MAFRNFLPTMATHCHGSPAGSWLGAKERSDARPLFQRLPETCRVFSKVRRVASRLEMLNDIAWRHSQPDASLLGPRFLLFFGRGQHRIGGVFQLLLPETSLAVRVAGWGNSVTDESGFIQVPTGLAFCLG